MKKALSILLAAAVSASLTLPAFAATFTDVNEKNYAWAYEYVEDMADKGLISGYPDGTFRPANAVSRMDAFSLFGRMMGSNNEQYAETIEAAKEKYASVLKGYNLSYAEDAVAFMLSRGAIDESELDTYFKGSKKTEPMPRYEAAILITKAMAAEKTATEEVLVDMDYTDVANIPKSARQYVYYVTQKSIMSGMGDGTFSPETSVLRSQMAVMLSRASDSMNYYFETIQLTGIDTAKKNIGILDDDGKNDLLGYTSDTVFVKNGEVVSADELSVGQSAVLTYSESDEGVRLMFVDVVAIEAEEEIRGIFQGYTSVGGELTLTVADPTTLKNTMYKCSSVVSVTKDGAVSSLNKLVKGDYVSVGMADNKAVAIETLQKNITIKNATLDAVTAMGEVTISCEDEEYDGMTYSLANDADIYKNGNTAEFTSLYRGDSLTVVLEYGVISRITATSKVSEVSGIIKSYTISANPTLTIKRDGKEYTYDIPANVEVTINGEKAKLADFEIGSSVTLTIESDAVKKIKAATAGGTTSSSAITGTVKAVNTSAKVIIVAYEEGGSETTAYITCTNSTKYYVIPTLNEYSLKNIQEGDLIVAYGAYSNGIFISTGITVTPSAK